MFGQSLQTGPWVGGGFQGEGGGGGAGPPFPEEQLPAFPNATPLLKRVHQPPEFHLDQATQPSCPAHFAQQSLGLVVLPIPAILWGLSLMHVPLLRKGPAH
jgi:hypothetical protein